MTVRQVLSLSLSLSLSLAVVFSMPHLIKKEREKRVCIRCHRVIEQVIKLFTKKEKEEEEEEEEEEDDEDEDEERVVN